MQKKWYLQSDMLIAFSALITSTVAVIVAIYSAHIDREYARASVWPSVLFTRSYNEGEYSFVAMNQGNGPAIIHYVKLAVNDTLVYEWQDVFELAGLPSARFTQSHLGSGIIRPGQQINAITIHDATLLPKFLKLKLGAQMCFCSLYGDCWVSDGFRVPQEVAACIIEDEERFLQ
ncbi:hypothetical protein [Alteromonas gilva]|uniref:Uncharacterized protein n=1 Tax=Alteromonas gilva TaxID=2987522 RepID=A0ABT5L300_9ALTE|nr:hypothetical protein [Alteromonas gilva]MDC8831425.1 hypothetical protein [Alteromonas gilva]